MNQENQYLKKANELFTCPYCLTNRTHKWLGPARLLLGIKEQLEQLEQLYPQNKGYYIRNGLYCLSNKGKDYCYIQARGVYVTFCDNCKGMAVWKCDDFWKSNLLYEMVYPYTAPVAPPNPHMPEDMKSLYNEARSVFNLSPRSSCLLLRLLLEKLCKYIVDREGNDEQKSAFKNEQGLNKQIKFLNKLGFLTRIMKMLEAINLMGNEGLSIRINL